ncbi:MAG: hypothetical protein OXO52_07990, partial [Rhodospirillales bacterium]|nr:hypothetical protein [Rhodospirillales bacterium]
MIHPNPATARARARPRRLLASLLGFSCLCIGIVAVAPLSAQVTTAQLDALRPRNIGPAVMSGRIVDLAVAESDPIKFYVASSTGGVYKT